MDAMRVVYDETEIERIKVEKLKWREYEKKNSKEKKD